MARDIGAALVGMEYIQLLPWARPAMVPCTIGWRLAPTR